MDPVETIQVFGDSTFALGLEAQNRGHTLWFYTPDQLSLDEGVVVAQGQAVTFFNVIGAHFKVGDIETRPLQDFDVILVRQDPPFDMAYITATHLLERLRPDTMVINNPAEIRNAPEKLFVTLYPDLIPPTLISRDLKTIIAFRKKHKDIIIKPLFGNGGEGVFRLQPNDQNLTSLIEMFFNSSREPVIAQAYRPAIRDGDKRVILVDGNAVGAVNRIPKDGEIRANFHVGGSAGKTNLTKRDREICTIIGPELRRRGLLFVGIDIIGNYITEINVTSPTGIREIQRLTNVDIAALTWDAIEIKHPAHTSNSIIR